MMRICQKLISNDDILSFDLILLSSIRYHLLFKVSSLIKPVATVIRVRTSVGAAGEGLLISIFICFQIIFFNF